MCIRDRGYYKRMPEYLPTLRRKRVGCLNVPVVHSTVLIDLNWENSQNLQYWPPPEGFTGPVDDIVQFSFSAKKEGQNERPFHIACVKLTQCAFILSVAHTTLLLHLNGASDKSLHFVQMVSVPRSSITYIHSLYIAMYLAV